MLTDTPNVSVIIPALNEEPFIGRCLGSLAASRRPHDRWEVIVVDNGSTDRTVEVARSFAGSLNLRVFERTGVRVSELRNFGAEVATGDYLIFLDADCVVAPEWIHRSVSTAPANRCALRGAHYLLPETSSWVARAWWRHEHRKRALSYLSAHNLHITREFFWRLQGFDRSLETNEDYEFSQRVRAAGGELIEAPDLAVVHLGNAQTIRHFFRRERWHGRDVLRVFMRDAKKRHNFRAISFAAYNLVFLTLLAAALPAAAAWNIWEAPALAAAGLLLPPVALALRAAASMGSWRTAPPLSMLFLVYGVARALALFSFETVSPRKLAKVATR